MNDSGMDIGAIRGAFESEIADAGGRVSDMFDDGGRLFGRSILPAVRTVGTGDNVQGGVAIRAGKQVICIHPYIFRLVCSNGAIMARVVETREIEWSGWGRVEEDVIADVRETVRLCAAEEVFAEGQRLMRSARTTEADLAVTLMPLLGRAGRGLPPAVLAEIVGRFEDEADRSRFGLMNAVTSVARDTSAPLRRWRLEELGGAVALGADRPPQPPPRRPLGVVVRPHIHRHEVVPALAGA